MQDINKIKENPELFKSLVQNKNIKLDIDSLLKLAEKRSSLIQEVDSLRTERNQNVSEIKSLGGKPPQELIDKGKAIKDKITALE